MDCHFLAQVKRNCRTLWETIALHTALTRPIASCQYYQDKHGYQVHRRVELYRNQAQLPKGWNGIERLVKVRRWGIRNGNPFEELAFYVLSKPLNSAATVAQAVQEHWGIENRLHWVKDVNLGEDHMDLRQPKSVAILAYLNNAALNILRNAGLKPTKDTFAMINNKVNELYKLFHIP
ncbi:MAG: ISAs1 family transposase [Bacteroidia bacterium]